MIIREKYLSKIRPFYNQDLIKVITGIRRCGKSVILTQIIDELKKEGITDEQIIYMNFESKEYSNIKNDDDLYLYIKKNLKNKNKYYLFFDEIQNVECWERTVNSFKADLKDNVSIFITGSNSDLLSGELATHLAGRYVSFKVSPFTFKEVCELKGILDKDKYDLVKYFNEYVIWGGLPQRFMLTSEEQVRTYLTDIYNSIVIKDIIERFGIKDLDLFNRIVEYIVTTPSQTFSAENLVNYFSVNDDRGVTKNTLYNYLEYMSKAMLISKVDRYDVRGKRILNGKYKYYLTDLGIGQVMNTSKKPQMGAYLENIVFNELISRGYDVKVGTLDNGEIDFMALKDGKKEYYQVCFLLGDNESVINREFKSLKEIDDNYPKFVISTDTFDMSEDGIIHKNIIDWLLER
ncbi:MAG: ATP-binding protein [Bacilli bacterium]|nr:ATP-binding protein [Bacilli bacterium]